MIYVFVYKCDGAHFNDLSVSIFSIFFRFKDLLVLFFWKAKRHGEDEKKTTDGCQSHCETRRYEFHKGLSMGGRNSATKAVTAASLRVHGQAAGVRSTASTWAQALGWDVASLGLCQVPPHWAFSDNGMCVLLPNEVTIRQQTCTVSRPSMLSESIQKDDFENKRSGIITVP